MIFRPANLSTIRLKKVDNFKNHFKHVKKSIKVATFFQQCELCHAQANHFVCEPCLDDILAPTFRCESCRLPLGNNEQTHCPECLRSRPSYDHCHTVANYAFPINTMAQRLKYSGKLYLADIIAYLMKRSLEAAHFDRPQLLLPMPISGAKLKHRGYNQAELIARHCSEIMDIPYDSTTLTQTIDKPSQVGNSRADRLENIKGSLRCLPQRLSTYTHVAVVDDVMTTGATLEEACRVIKEAGVNRVDAWVFARTPKPEMT